MTKKLTIVLVTLCILLSTLFSLKWVVDFIFELKLDFLGGTQERGNFYCLYRDSGIDVKWLVYEYSSSCPSISSYENINYNKNLLFYTWDDGAISHDAKIFAHNGFLIFYKDGLFQSLYDINNSEVLLNYNDIEFEVNSDLGKDYTQEQLREWKVKNIHNKIIQIIDK